MRSRLLSLLPLLSLATVPGLALSCGSYQVVGSQCARTVYLGWGIGGLGGNSTIVLYVPGTVSAPVTFQLNQLNSSLGTSYSGTFGVMAALGVNGTPALLTLANQTPYSLNPGRGTALTISQVCFDALCVTSPPANAVGNMFSMQFLILSSNPADLAQVPLPFLNVRFVSGGIVNYEEQEVAVENVSLLSAYAVDQMDEGAAPAGRYVYTGTAVNLPFVAVSITNPSATQTLTGTVNILNYDGAVLETAAVPPIPPLGAGGFLLIANPASSTTALFPASTVLTPLEAGSTSLHGALQATFSGTAIFLAQEFEGQAMLNLVVEP
jgi:hypothetical protein